MAVYSGKDGVVWAAALELNVRSWSISMSAGVQTGAHSSSLGWTDAVSGVKSWTGTIEVYADDAAPATVPFVLGDSVVFQLWDGKRSFDGTAIIADTSYDCDVEGGGLATNSASITGHGELVIAAATPS